MFQAFTLNIMRVKQTNIKTIITTYKEFLATCIESKKQHVYRACINNNLQTS